LIAARELVRRWLAEEMKLGAVLFEPSKVKEYLQVSTRGLEHEVFLGLFLDSRNRLIVALELFRGTLTQTSVYPREVVRAALKVNAASMIVAHNHPSGSHEPSQADRMLTRTLREALALVDVALLDHFIVSDTVVVSLAERGEM
jgi:DNA repair protein RadC